MTYEEALEDLQDTLADAVVLAGRCYLEGDEEQGHAPAEFIAVRKALERLEKDVECIADHGISRKELSRLRATYIGEIVAGLHGGFTNEGLAMRIREMKGKT